MVIGVVDRPYCPCPLTTLPDFSLFNSPHREIQFSFFPPIQIRGGDQLLGIRWKELHERVPPTGVQLAKNIID